MSSVPTDTLLVGKVLGVGAVGLTQQVLWVATTYVLLKSREPLMARLGAPSMTFSLPNLTRRGDLFLTSSVSGHFYHRCTPLSVGGEQRAGSAAGGDAAHDHGGVPGLFISRCSSIPPVRRRWCCRCCRSVSDLMPISWL